MDNNSKTNTTSTPPPPLSGPASAPLTPSAAQAEHSNKKDAESVVDSPGVFDTNLENYDNVLKFSQTMIEAMSMCNGIGYHALLIVLKYGNRLTQEELDGIDTIKEIFGEDLFKKHGIIIMTYGDNFQREVTETFQDWCGQQTGPFKNLLDHCAGRILLFDNATEDEAKITTMRDSLLECIARLPSNGERYTNDQFHIVATE
ncbi:immune-associated nucleotide-binding protein 7 [Plakobranchus ocellatus]|uniref:Immune-associated nucleotide-binding protein 7 n=1 Tax=Plakobranchus ocellatus TaxID=259542 RepID=A0AAV3ZPX7_9GAST|nr:immune-associated nucleotide-binding protein 7 [Plakobranchus ocellatus]